MSEASPKITVLFPLYNAEKTTEALVDGLLKQVHPEYAKQSDWLRAIFIDDGSKDKTLAAVREALSRNGNPSHIRLEPNPKNLGLAGSLNRGLGMVETPFVLTCHVDCLFGTPGYVARMLELLEKTPKAAAVTGQPTVGEDPSKIPFAEKVNLIANLMDIFPVETEEDLIPVGFAEGRCDAFRMEAMRKVGFYDTTLRTSGEDQLLAAKFRREGYELYQAPKLTYFLSVSDSQDTLGKLVKHERLLARTAAYLVFKGPGTTQGIMGARAGKNRSTRTFLRMTHLLSAVTYIGVVLGWLLGAPVWIGLLTLTALFSLKYSLFRAHHRAIPMSLLEWFQFYLFQPIVDFAYTAGFAQGAWIVLIRALTRKKKAEPIA